MDLCGNQGLDTNIHETGTLFNDLVRPQRAVIVQHLHPG